MQWCNCGDRSTPVAHLACSECGHVISESSASASTWRVAQFLGSLPLATVRDAIKSSEAGDTAAYRALREKLRAEFDATCEAFFAAEEAELAREDQKRRHQTTLCNVLTDLLATEEQYATEMQQLESVWLLEITKAAALTPPECATIFGISATIAVGAANLVAALRARAPAGAL
eukprot:m51a1_g12891 hypothetical protein (174) ;mRNA; f:1700-2771